MRLRYLIPLLLALPCLAQTYTYTCPKGAGSSGTHTWILQSGATVNDYEYCGMAGTQNTSGWFGGSCALNRAGGGAYSDNVATALTGQVHRCWDVYLVGSSSSVNNGHPTKVIGYNAGGGIIVSVGSTDNLTNSQGTGVDAIIPRLLADGWNVVVFQFAAHAIAELNATINNSVTTLVVKNAGQTGYYWPTSASPNYVITMCDNLPGTGCEDMLVTAGTFTPPMSSTVSLTVTRGYNSTTAQAHTVSYPVYASDASGNGAWETSTYSAGGLSGSSPLISYGDVECMDRTLGALSIGDGKTFSWVGGSQTALLMTMNALIGANITPANCEAVASGHITPSLIVDESLPASNADPALRGYCYTTACNHSNGLETTSEAANLGPGYAGTLDSSSTGWAAGLQCAGVACTSGNTVPDTNASGVIPITPSAAYTKAMTTGPRGCIPNGSGSCVKTATTNVPPIYVISGSADNAIWSPIQPAYVAGQQANGGSLSSITQTVIAGASHFLDTCTATTQPCVAYRGYFLDVHDALWGGIPGGGSSSTGTLSQGAKLQ